MTLMFHSLEILQPPEDGSKKVVDRKSEAKNVDDPQTNKTKHQNLVFPMHLVICISSTTNPTQILTITSISCLSANFLSCHNCRKAYG